MRTHRKNALVFLLLCISIWMSSRVVTANMSCTEQKDHVLFLFRESIGNVRQFLRTVEGAGALSPSTRGEFRQEAEWLVAWLEDQSERIQILEDCSELPLLSRDAVTQIRPVEALSRKIQATLILWELDQLSREAEIQPEGKMLIAAARAEFQRVIDNSEDRIVSRVALRRGAFIVRILLRFLRVRAILI